MPITTITTIERGLTTNLFKNIIFILWHSLCCDGTVYIAAPTNYDSTPFSEMLLFFNPGITAFWTTISGFMLLRSQSVNSHKLRKYENYARLKVVITLNNDFLIGYIFVNIHLLSPFLSLSIAERLKDRVRWWISHIGDIDRRVGWKRQNKF